MQHGLYLREQTSESDEEEGGIHRDHTLLELGILFDAVITICGIHSTAVADLNPRMVTCELSRVWCWWRRGQHNR